LLVRQRLVGDALLILLLLIEGALDCLRRPPSLLAPRLLLTASYDCQEEEPSSPPLSVTVEPEVGQA